MKLFIDTWNVRTMLGNDSRPEAHSPLIYKKLHRYEIDIAALQETGIDGQGQVYEETHHRLAW